jgi:deoxyadenosine/deoxycytidine kinase
MIIMINGAFGVGKTSVAMGLVQHVNNSMIYDPEEVGFMLRNIINKGIRKKGEDTDDFQDLELWRKVTVQIAKDLIDTYKMNLIVPMTIYKKEYFDYICRGFNEIDRDTYQFCLTASLDTIHNRLETRGDTVGSWPYQQTIKAMQAFNEYDFNEYIDTENCNVNEIVTIISRIVNDSL